MSINIAITAGGTSERIDDVRTITNMSTGKLGAVICDTLLSRIPDEIGEIYYICSNKAIRPLENSKIQYVFIKGTYDLKEKVESLLKGTNIDFFIHSMAVSDYTTDYVSTTKNLVIEIGDTIWKCKDNMSRSELYDLIDKVLQNPDNTVSCDKKMSSSENGLIIKLKQTPKVVSVIKPLQPSTTLIGFKLLSNVTEEELFNVAFDLLKKNNCDYVVANDLANIRKGEHKALIIDKLGNRILTNGKNDIAEQIVNIVNGR